MQQTTNTLNDQEVKVAVELLRKIEPQQPLPQELFYAIMRIVSSPVVEVVPWRVNPETEEKEILFIKRAISDPTWPGMFHTPGVIVRPSDGNNYTNCIRRIANDELGNIEWERLHFLLITMGESERGHLMSIAFSMKISGGTDMSQYGEWYPLGEFPTNCIQGQLGFLKKSTSLIKNFSD